MSRHFDPGTAAPEQTAPPKSTQAPASEGAITIEDFNALVDANNRALQAMAQNAGVMTKLAARSIFVTLMSRPGTAFD